MFFTASHHVTMSPRCSFHVLSILYILHTFDPLMFLGSSTGRRVIHWFRIALQPRRDQKLLQKDPKGSKRFQKVTLFYILSIVLFFCSIFLVGFFASFFYTFSTFIHLISVLVRMQVVSTLSKHSNCSGRCFLHIAM